MKLLLKISDMDVRFSNPSEGFNIAIDNPSGDSYLNLYLEPWDALPKFVSAVADYSWSNSLCEVTKEDLKTMASSLETALSEVNKELKERQAQ